MHKIVSAKIQKTLQTIDIVRLKNLNKYKNRLFPIHTTLAGQSPEYRMPKSDEPFSNPPPDGLSIINIYYTFS